MYEASVSRRNILKSLLYTPLVALVLPSRQERCYHVFYPGRHIFILTDKGENVLSAFKGASIDHRHCRIHYQEGWKIKTNSLWLQNTICNDVPGLDYVVAENRLEAARQIPSYYVPVDEIRRAGTYEEVNM